MLRVALAWLHLTALAVGFAAVWVRGSALAARPLGREAVQRALVADLWWGIAALLWLGTGLWRLFAETEKTIPFYLQNAAFHAKMGLFLLVLLLELWPMTALIRWRLQAARAGAAWTAPEPQARRIATISRVEAVVLLLIVLAANLMARGYGALAAG